MMCQCTRFTAGTAWKWYRQLVGPNVRVAIIIRLWMVFYRFAGHFTWEFTLRLQISGEGFKPGAPAAYWKRLFDKTIN